MRVVTNKFEHRQVISTMSAHTNLPQKQPFFKRGNCTNCAVVQCDVKMKYSLNAALLQNVFFLHDVFNQKFELLCSFSFCLKKPAQKQGETF